jgi:hypothetical protein
VREEVVRRFNNTKLSEWRNTRPETLPKSVLEWNNADLGDALKPFESRFSNLQPSAWLRVRDFALQESGSSK